MFSAGHGECKVSIRSHQNQIELSTYAVTSTLSPGEVSRYIAMVPKGKVER